MINIAITGATGLLGRHLLFEIIKQHLHNLDNLRIFILGRHTAEKSLESRIAEIIASEGFSYWDIEPSEYDDVLHFIENNLYYIHTHLQAQIPIADPVEYTLLRNTPIDHFFHLAALPDLRSNATTEERVMQANFHGTKRLLELVSRCCIREFDYVGTAFVCGKTSGRIMPDYLNPASAFNNPYEKSKLLAELAVMEYGKQYGVRCRYFRPGIVCGRLLEKPIGHAHKFDVFYEIFAFLFIEKVRAMKTTDRFFETPVSLDLRLVFDPTSGANIVPVDYLVKVMYQVCLQQPSNTHFHLVHEQNINFQHFLEATLEAMNIMGVRQVNDVPTDITPVERLYHSRVGAIFNPYLSAKPKIFDTTNLQPILKNSKLSCPTFTQKNIQAIMRYATQKQFGLDMRKIIRKATT